MNIVAHGVSDPGRRRQRNEDTFFLALDHGVVAVFDGMGGHNAGDVAATTASSELRAYIEEHFPEVRRAHNRDPLVRRLLSQGIEKTNQRVLRKAKEQSGFQGMGTTVVTAWFAGENVSFAHVGDSRLYVVRERRIKQLTEDHSLLNEYLANKTITPDEVKDFKFKNVITQALGLDRALDVSLRTVRPREQDVFVLCTDGLTDVVGEREILAIVHQGNGDTSWIAQSLVDLANHRGGPDNVTVVAVRVDSVEPEPPPRVGLLDRLAQLFRRRFGSPSMEDSR